MGINEYTGLLLLLVIYFILFFHLQSKLHRFDAVVVGFSS